MVLCIVALVVFAVLGIFSVGYRKLAIEAFDCVIRKATLRPCESGLEDRMRAKIVAETLKRHEGAAALINKNFETLSLIFTILFFASLGYTLYSVYNLITLGTCEPGGNCIFAPPGKPTPPGVNTCNITATFVEFYGEECPHCKKMIPIIQQVENETGIAFLKLEVWHNDTNQEHMSMHASDIERDCGLVGVPTFLSTKTNKSVCGEMTADTLKQFIRENG
jgi:thiol-disulfide isomerase/thioredoxin